MSFDCNICNKQYSSKTSLCNHNKIKHHHTTNGTEQHQCRYCKKEYNFYKSKWKHENKCRSKTEETNLINKLKQESESQKEKILELQNKLLTTNRIDNKTFKAVNKILIQRSQSSDKKNTYKIIALGSEELPTVFTPYEKKQIMNSRLCSIEKIVELTHCGKLNQFKNIIITNLKDNYAYKYDESKGFFITVSKVDLLDDIMNYRMMDIETIYDELKAANKIDEKTKKLIQDFMERMNCKDMPFYDNEKKYDNFKTFKTDKIKILLYNNQDKITKDIALLISDNCGDEMTTNEIVEETT
jgi:hypothetical protein